MSTMNGGDISTNSPQITRTDKAHTVTHLDRRRGLGDGEGRKGERRQEIGVSAKTEWWGGNQRSNRTCLPQSVRTLVSGWPDGGTLNQEMRQRAPSVEPLATMKPGGIMRELWLGC
ncbi:hypothetical protein EYF80_006694 [Liparis tanakae]|uniref:Uncharacterized protein n=1 Tax=Liparis tanakae TaxID=230148 RepID=A0A4Z2IZA8_9TELE|nr:hypothetical protein EYF80_006694 [Liparis tanakae]